MFMIFSQLVFAIFGRSIPSLWLKWTEKLWKNINQKRINLQNHLQSLNPKNIWKSFLPALNFGLETQILIEKWKANGISHNNQEQFTKMSSSTEQKGRKIQRWSEIQNHRYAQWLKCHYERMEMGKSRERRSKRIFILMSEFVASKDPNQCRSHHQKMMKKYGCVQTVIASLISIYGSIMRIEEEQEGEINTEGISPLNSLTKLPFSQEISQFLILEDLQN